MTKTMICMCGNLFLLALPCHPDSGKTRRRNGVAEPFRAASVSERTVKPVRSLTVAALHSRVKAIAGLYSPQKKAGWRTRSKQQDKQIGRD
jgi:hypothetical protein